MQNRPIGGYFELELRKGMEYHSEAIKLNSGRHCLEYILRLRGYSKMWVPYYTCDTVLEPINKLNLEYAFYKIDKKLEPLFDLESIKSNEAFIYTNYFGVKDQYIENMPSCKNIVIDNSQAFYAEPRECFDTFYSPRKFFGVPGGGYLYTYNQDVLDIDLKVSVSYDRCSHLLKRIDLGPEAGYSDFKDNDSLVSGFEMMRISKLTQMLLSAIDYSHIKEKRKTNFEYIHNHIGHLNKLDLCESDFGAQVPLVYPLLIDKKGLREKLIKSKIFVAQYWPNVLGWSPKESFEYYLTEHLLPIPIDQRLDNDDLYRIKNTLI